MFITQGVPVALSLDQAQLRLDHVLRGPAFLTMSTAAFASGIGHLHSCGLDVGLPPIDVAVLPRHQRGAIAVYPMRWRTSPANPDAVPPLDANLELGPAMTGAPELSLIGSYRPDMSASIGRDADPAVLAAAEATVTSLLRQLKAAIEPQLEWGSG